MARIVGKGALLLTVVWGEKEGSYSLMLKKKKSELYVLKGTLLISMSDKDIIPRADGKPSHNYYVYKSEETTLYCSAEDVSPLTNYEFQLLNAIKSLGARYGVFENGILEWGSKLIKNDVVYVNLPSNQVIGLKRCRAEIRSVGQLPNEEGIQFGLEIMEEQYRGEGYSNGMFQGQQFFVCEENCGVFESLDKLAPITDHKPLMKETLQATPTGTKPNTRGSEARQGPYGATHSQTPKDQHSTEPPPPRFKKGDRVVVHNKNQHAMHGTVRWIGQANTDGDKVNAVGIETDISVSNEEFLLAFTGLGQDFKCQSSSHGKVVLPESLVHTEWEIVEMKRPKDFAQPASDHEETNTQQHEEKEMLRRYPQEHNSKATAIPSQGHDFKMNSAVQFSDPPQYGAIRWMGTMPGIEGDIAGLELEEDMEGCSDGTWKGMRYFSCRFGRAFFCPLSSLKHRQPMTEQPHQPPNYQPPMTQEAASGVNPDQNAVDPNLSMGSTVQVGDPKAPYYGVIRWIGSFSGSDEALAGIELEQYAERCGDGSFEGVRYFTCTFGKGYFCPITQVKPDQRFVDVSTTPGSASSDNDRKSFPHEVSQGSVYVDSQHEMEQIKRENADLKVEVVQIQKRLEDEISELQLEKAEALEQQKHRFSRQQVELQQSQQHVEQLEQEKQQLQHQVDQLCVQTEDLQQRIDTSVTSSDESRFTKVQIPLQAEDSWNVRRQEVIIQQELGHGAWGSVCKGTFRGQTVAVKRAHEEILYDNTIDQLKREIRIMVHVQHPNLVRLIAAVVDRNVELRTDSPLLVLELLDTNLRSAYKEKNLKANNLVSIFRDVAYALHYLHEHQEPIIHRDVSAPNVLLEEVHPGVWRAKLSDFGSANLVKHCKTAGAGAIIYSAPETFPPDSPEAPLPKQTTKIDVFSYGYLLAEVIAKEMPSADKRREMLAKIQRQWRSMYELILACIKRKPEERLTITQVLEKLNAIPNQ